ncbi:non-homologous end-joining DNA ligase [Georgenia sp. MJ206]|uniref:non-homologous end-joining DNA ligase n=1 Tax=Georgenia wangjunii TaxID=3117730 RepID=UPI002F26DEF7
MARKDQPETVTIDGRRLRLTNLSKVLYPVTGTTKAEVIAYYAEIAPVMLPHCAGRVATRKRWPNGVGTADEPGQMFFQKNLDDSTPDWVVRAALEHSSRTAEYPLVDDAATLAWLAQIAALEIHVPQWRVGSDGERRNPDRLVLDLDPGEGAGLVECADVARLARGILDGMGLEPVPVTSGSKGIHLYAPLAGTHTSEQISDLAHELARALEADHPDLVVSDMKKTLRRGKVLVDWSQNNGSKTTIAPYSLRGRERPTVAAPRTWREIAHPALRHLEYGEVLDRVRRRGDPMAGLGAVADRAGGQPARDRLEIYRAKRDATKTPEPVPERIGGGTGEPTFVIQEHHARRLHWDLRLAHDGVLVSWALPKGVPVDAAKNHLAVQTEDHPMEYATFSGTIPAGEYGAGEMTIWDSGTYELEKWREGREVIVTLTGRSDGGLAGPDGPGRTSRFALIRTGGRGGREDNQWLIHLMKSAGGSDQAKAAVVSGDDEAAEAAEAKSDRAGQDEADGYDEEQDDPAEDDEHAEEEDEDEDDEADDGDGAADEDDEEGDAADDGDEDDVGSAEEADGDTETEDEHQRAADESAGGDARIEAPRPMLATLGEVRDLLRPEDWALEMKWDGIRAVVVVEDGEVRLASRRGHDMTATYPELADVARCVGASSAILDGEIVALDDRGRPSFGVLQQRMNLTRPADINRAVGAYPVRLMLFDVLEVDGVTWRSQTYDARREALQLLVDPDRHPLVDVPPAYEGDVEEAIAASRAWRLEGVMAKRRDSTYADGRRSRSWLKIKHAESEEVVVVGWRPGQGSRAGQVGSFLLAVPGDDGALTYVGKVGSGFSEREATDWVAKMSRLERRTPPLVDVPRADARDARWVTPRLVAEVEFAEVTATGRLRHPRWRGWRPDKAPEEVAALSALRG